MDRVDVIVIPEPSFEPRVVGRGSVGQINKLVITYIYMYNI